MDQSALTIITILSGAITALFGALTSGTTYDFYYVIEDD